jgi:hypothetical protein
LDINSKQFVGVVTEFLMICYKPRMVINIVYYENVSSSEIRGWVNGGEAISVYPHSKLLNSGLLNIGREL